MSSQQTFTWSKATTETQEKVWKLYKISNKDATTSITSFWCLDY